MSKLSVDNPLERNNWRSGVRSALGKANQLPGRRPTDVGLHVNQKPNENDDILFIN